jgi:predicted dehydrogenase
MNVLIVGFGSIAKKHCQALLTINPDTNIFALRSNNNAEIFSGITNIYDPNQLSKIKFDFIIISSPTFLHEKHIRDMIQLNKPLFIEKPLANKLEIKKIIDLVDTHQIKTYIACNLRFLESLIYVKKQYSNLFDQINEINAYCGSYLPYWRPGQDYKKGYSASSKMGGGAHLDLIHELDYLYWFFGSPNKTTKLLKSNSKALKNLEKP